MKKTTALCAAAFFGMLLFGNANACLSDCHLHFREEAEIVNVEKFTITTHATQKRHALKCVRLEETAEVSQPRRRHDPEDFVQAMSLESNTDGPEVVIPCEHEKCLCQHSNRYVETLTPVERFRVTYEWRGRQGQFTVGADRYQAAQKAVTLKIAAQIEEGLYHEGSGHYFRPPWNPQEKEGKPQVGIAFLTKPDSIHVDTRKGEINRLVTAAEVLMECGKDRQGDDSKLGHSYSCGSCTCTEVSVDPYPKLLLGHEIVKHRVHFSWNGKKEHYDFDEVVNPKNMRLYVTAQPIWD